MMWVHGEHLGQLRLSLVVGFAINQAIGHQQACAGMIWVSRQSRLQMLRHRLAVRGRKRAGGAEMQIGVFRVPL